MKKTRPTFWAVYRIKSGKDLYLAEFDTIMKAKNYTYTHGFHLQGDLRVVVVYD